MSSTPPDPAAIQLDDRDPHIKYFGPWFDVTTSNAAVANRTLSSTADASAGFEYAFSGIQISVYGTVLNKNGAQPPIIRFTIDGDPAFTFVAPPLTIEGDGLLLFKSGELSPTAHQIVANTTRASGDSPFYLDFISVLPIGATFPSSSSSSSSSSTTSPSSSSSSTTSPSTSPSSTPPPSTPSAPSTSTDGIPSPSGSSPSDNQSTVQSKSSKAGPIAGGVVGGVVIVALILLGICFWRRRTRRNGLLIYPPDAGITPAMRDTSAPVGAGVVRDYEQGDGRVTPYFLPTNHTASRSGLTEGGSAPGSTHPGSHLVSSTTATTSYFAHADASASHPLLEAASNSDYSSGAGQVLVSVVPRPGASALHSPPISSTDTSSRSDKQPISPDFATSGRSQRPRALPSPSPPPQHADSGVRFSPNAPPEEALVSIGAPPAYTAD